MAKKIQSLWAATKLDINSLWEIDKRGRIFLTQQKKYADFPDLLDLQKSWFDSFVNHYLQRLFSEINPIQDIAWEKMMITIEDIKVLEPTNDVDICKKKELTYWWIITGKIMLIDAATQKTMFSKRANIGILPIMTKSASYVINGVERVLISQIIRSYWIFYGKKDLKYTFKLIPERGPWLEIFIEKSWNVVARINKSRKFVITSLLRVLWFETDESIRELFKWVFDEEDTNYLEYVLTKDNTTDALSAAEYIYWKLRPGELVDPENALDYIKSQFLSPDRIHVWRIARRKINAKLWLDKPLDWDIANIFDVQDLVSSLIYLFNLANLKRKYYYDDSDHLANKRVRTMGEILHAHLGPVMRRFVKSVKGKLSVLNAENPIKLTDLVNFKMIDNSIKSFFATSQLSQFLDQINPLAEIEHKRRLTALGPGWLKRETAKFDVRDLHPSHYGRICPIETPEWQNIGLVLYQALYSRVNQEWFLETPALRIHREVSPKKSELVDRIANQDIFELAANWKATTKLIVADSEYITTEMADTIEKQYWKLWTMIKVKAFFTDEVDYISPEMDERFTIADVTTVIDKHNNLLNTRVPWRHFNQMDLYHQSDLTHIDVNPSQIFSANTALIPFVNHNDAVRAMMGTNQHRQWLPLLKNEAPFVWTGLEWDILNMTHSVILAEWEWEVIYVDWKRIKVKYKKLWTKEYAFEVFKKSNQKTLIHKVPRVSLGQKVQQGDLLAEWPCAQGWEMAVGKNIRVAYMSWEWYNFEDAIVISQRLVKDDELTSIHIESYQVEVSDTKLGPEETTNDIPWVSMNKLKSLDIDGIVRIWTTVTWWDILVGKITPKSEWELSPEEKLIQAIFWDKSKSLKDTSLYLPAWTWGKVIDVVILDSNKWDNLLAWVKKKIKVYIASTRKIEIWDKLSAKHANKWIISNVVAQEDMPFTEDGHPIDILLNPLGIVGRMNLWQLFETNLWLIAKTLWVRFAVPTFSKFSSTQIKALAVKCGLPEDLKLQLFDGRTWVAYPTPVTVWYLHMMKLNHMVEDKIHARSVWPYSLITQQPLWGKARDWWQRFWEMEVWALEAYSAVYTLQEMLTIKSDDVLWRNKTYESIIKGMKPKVLWLPESFNYLTFLLKWLCQDIVHLGKDEIDRIHKERLEKIMHLGLAGISWNEDWVNDKDGDSDSDTDWKQEMLDNIIEELEKSWDMD